MGTSDWIVSAAAGLALVAAGITAGSYVLILTSGRTGADPALDKWARRCTRGLAACAALAAVAAATGITAGGVSGWVWPAGIGIALLASFATAGLSGHLCPAEDTEKP